MGLATGGFIFRCHCALTNRQQESRIFIGVVAADNIFDLHGYSNTITESTAILGFIINLSFNSNFNIVLIKGFNGSNTLFPTAVGVTAGDSNDFQIEWHPDQTIVKFTYNCSSTLVKAFGTNPPTNSHYDPCVSVNVNSSNDFGLFINQIKVTSYKN